MKPKISSNPNLIKKLPKEVKILFEIFGDEIRLVGGCVRDMLLKKEVSDFDFATKTLPQKTVKILEKNKIKAVPTGVKFGTITAVVNGKNFEITTLRKDNETDGRHCNPEFVDDFYFDAARRDFTINALYLDSKGCVTDYFDGISDIKNKKVRFIGDANQRIEEDFLRILRFFRFSSRYAKKLDSKGLMSCVKHKKNLKKLSRERIRAEFLKMLTTTKKQDLLTVLKVLKSKKIAAEIITANLDIKALEQLFESEKKFKISASLNLKLATLFYEKDFDDQSFFTEICATNSEKKYFQFLTDHRARNLNQLLANAEKETVLELYLLGVAKGWNKAKIAEVKKTITFLKKFQLPKFPLASADLMEMGLAGKQLGMALQKAKEIWAANDFKSTKSELIKRLK